MQSEYVPSPIGSSVSSIRYFLKNAEFLCNKKSEEKIKIEKLIGSLKILPYFDSYRHLSGQVGSFQVDDQLNLFLVWAVQVQDQLADFEEDVERQMNILQTILFN